MYLHKSSGCNKAEGGSLLQTPAPSEADEPSAPRIPMTTEVSEEDVTLRMRGVLDNFSTYRFPAVVFIHFNSEKENSPGSSNTVIKAFLSSATPIFSASNWFWEELRLLALDALRVTSPYNWMMEQNMFRIRNTASFAYQAWSLMDRDVTRPVQVNIPISDATASFMDKPALLPPSTYCNELHFEVSVLFTIAAVIPERRGSIRSNHQF